MSFGKDQAHLRNIGAYGASTRQLMGNASRRTRRAPFKRAYWADNYRPSDTAQDAIRLIPGEFTTPRITEEGSVYEEITPWLERVEHYHGGLRRGALCSAGVHRNTKSSEPCIGCDIFWEDWRVRKAKEQETGVRPQNPRRVSARDLYVFLVLDMGCFFRTEQLDYQTGQVKMNPKTNKPYMTWEKYTGPHQNTLVEGKETQWGMVKAFPMGRDYFNILNTYGDLIANNCAGCGGTNTIHTSSWNCGNCATPLLDAATAGLTPEQIKEMTRKHITCSQCGQRGYPQEVVSCTNCSTPTPTSIFDVNLTVMRGTDPNTNKGQLMITGYSPPCAIDPRYNAVLEKIPDLEKKYTPTPVSEQRTLFDVGPEVAASPAPSAQVPAAQMPPAQPYAQQPSAITPPAQMPQAQPPAPVATPPAVVANPAGYGGYGQQ